MRFRRSLNHHAVDAAVLLIAVLWEVEAWVDGPTLVAVAAGLVGTVPLLLRRRLPFAAPAIVFVGLAGLALTDPGAAADGEILRQVSLFSLALAFWFAGAQVKGEQAIAGTAIGLASIAAAGRTAGVEFVVTEADSETGIIGLWLLAAPLSVAAFALQRRTRTGIDLEERAARLEREREERTREAVAAERSRIARDLHDIFAHSVSVMTVQAGAARLLLDEDPERARDPLLTVEATGRQALDEMRRLLGILRADNGYATFVRKPAADEFDPTSAALPSAGGKR